MIGSKETLTLTLIEREKEKYRRCGNNTRKEGVRKIRAGGDGGAHVGLPSANTSVGNSAQILFNPPLPTLLFPFPANILVSPNATQNLPVFSVRISLVSRFDHFSSRQ